MTDKGLLDVAHRIVVDEDFRKRFLVAPQDVLADLGVSPEAYKALIAVVSVLLGGGIGLFAELVGMDQPQLSPMSWGRPGS